MNQLEYEGEHKNDLATVMIQQHFWHNTRNSLFPTQLNWQAIVCSTFQDQFILAVSGLKSHCLAFDSDWFNHISETWNINQSQTKNYRHHLLTWYDLLKIEVKAKTDLAAISTVARSVWWWWMGLVRIIFLMTLTKCLTPDIGKYSYKMFLK